MRRFAQLVSMILLALSSAQALATTLTFADYPRYGLQAPAEHLLEFKRFAQALVDAALAGKRVDVTVTGHADFDATTRSRQTRGADLSRGRLPRLLEHVQGSPGADRRRLQRRPKRVTQA